MSLGYIFLCNADLPNLPAQFADLSIQDWDVLFSGWPKSISSWTLLCWDVTMRQCHQLQRWAGFYMCWSRLMVTSSCPSPATSRRDSHIILPPTSLEVLWNNDAVPQTLIPACIKGRMQMWKGFVPNLLFLVGVMLKDRHFNIRYPSASGVCPSVYPPIS